MSQDIAPIQLKWYQRIFVNSNKKLVKAPSDRIISIDWCKGFSVFCIVYDHLGWSWLLPELYWYGRFLYMFLIFAGPVTFVFYAGINTTMSYRFARSRKIPHAMIYYETFRRMLGLYFVEMMSRVILYFSGLSSMTPLTMFFQWDILQTIAFSVILVVPLLKLSPRTRLIIAAVILAASYPFYQFLVQYQTESLPAQILIVVMYAPYLSFGPLPVAGGFGCPLFPMLAFTIIGSIVIDLLLPLLNGKKSEMNSTLPTSSQNNHVKSRTIKNPFKGLLLISLAILIISIIFGWGPTEDPFFKPVADLFLSNLYLNQFFLSWDHLPQFLIDNHPWNFLFKIGMVLCLFLSALYYFDLKKREHYVPSRGTRILSFWGQFSLSYYAYSFLFAALPLRTGILGFGIGTAVALILLTLLFQLYVRKAYGSGFVEFVMVTFALIWKIPPSIKDVAAVYPEKVAQYQQALSGEKKNEKS